MKNTNWWEMLQGIKWTPMNIVKAIGLGFLCVVALAIIIQMLSPVFTSLSRISRGVGIAPSTMPMMAVFDTNSSASSYYKEEAYGGYAADGIGGGVALSSRNMMDETMPPLPEYQGTTGNDAEAFEVTDYSVQFETGNKDATCAQITELKPLEYVIFEQANEYDRGCSYTFKVAHDHVSEVLALMRKMNPKDLSESAYTIKQQVEDFTSQEEILSNKLDSIDETLTQALGAYEEITRLATNTQNADALAKIIDSKVGVIERLTQQKIELTAQLERLARSKTEQLDRLEYTYFNVSVYENKLANWEDLGDSWKQGVKNLITNINGTIQDITIGIIAFILSLLQFILYIFIIVFVAKYVWKGVVYLWKR